MAAFLDVLREERAFLNKGEDARLVGLALSGGGVRSATFAIGAMQALAKSQLLSKFDYVSGVSGGCYALAWLVSWCFADDLGKEADQRPPSTHRSSGVAEFEKTIASGRTTPDGYEEPESLNRVRKHSNFLTPHLDITKDDRWIFLATYVLNLGANLALVLPLLFCVLFLPLSAAAAGKFTSDVARDISAISLMFCWLLTVHISIAAKSSGESRRKVNSACSVSILLWYASLLLIFVHILPRHLEQLTQHCTELFEGISSRFSLRPSNYSILFTTICLGLLFLVKQTIQFKSVRGLRNRFDNFIRNTPVLLWPLLSLAVLIAVCLVFTVTMPFFFQLLSSLNIFDAPANVKLFVFGPPVGCVALCVAAVASLRILSENLSEVEREAISWWLGRTLVYTVGLSALSFVAFFAVSILQRFNSYLVFICVALMVCFLLSLMIHPRRGLLRSALDLLGSLAPSIIGFCSLLWLMKLDTNLVCPGYAHDWDWAKCGSSSKVIVSWFLALLMAHLMAGKGDRFSMTAFYRNRLINCYFPVRGKSDRSGLVNEGSDFPLAKLAEKNTGGERKYSGPYPIINVTLNSLRTRQLNWQERKACSFVFTPLFYGFDVPKAAKEVDKELGRDGFVRTEKMGGNGISLAYAAAISGAAISPYRGSLSSRPVAFLLALLNLRLGAWIVNPRLGEQGVGEAPDRFETLLPELFGLTSEYDKSVYLSDGGHFENLGIYELVKRRCRTIVSIDSTQDPAYGWNSLAAAIEKCRVDLGTEISITDPDEIWDGLHLVRGQILYSRSGLGDDGDFFCVKSCLLDKLPLKDLPLDVKHYARENASFPHDTTRNQWFGERRFESYRALGESVTSEYIEQIKRAITPAKAKVMNTSA